MKPTMITSKTNTIQIQMYPDPPDPPICVQKSVDDIGFG